MQNSFAAGCGGAGGRAESKRECESAKRESAYLHPVFSRSIWSPSSSIKTPLQKSSCECMRVYLVSDSRVVEIFDMAGTGLSARLLVH